MAKETVIHYTCEACVYHEIHGDESCYYEPKPIWRKGARPACHHIKLTQKAKGK